MANKNMGIVKDDDEDFNEPVTMEGQIEKLKLENLAYREDPLWALFFSVTRKANEISRALNNVELKLDSEDKVFDRFIKLVEKLDPMVSVLSKLRQDYLKLPEDEVEQAEKKGIPLIERRAANTKRGGK
jgi:hypothetical protein